jgi:DNA-binding NarL/FixJ family response regulator
MKQVGVFIEEDQEILREAYRLAFLTEPHIHLIGVSDEQSSEAFIDTLSTLTRSPDVVVIGNKNLQPEIIEKLELIRKTFPRMGLVLLFGHCSASGTRRLREFAKRSFKGCAYLSKYSVDTIAQLAQVIYAVAQGRIMIDPGVMDGFLAEESGAPGHPQPHGQRLQKLHHRRGPLPGTQDRRTTHQPYI